MFTVTEVKDMVKNSVDNYFGLADSDLLEFYTPMIDIDSKEIIPPYLEVFYLGGVNLDTSTLVYNLTEESIGPFDMPDPEIKRFLYSIEKLHLSFNIEHSIPVDSLDNVNCFAWKIF